MIRHHSYRVLVATHLAVTHDLNYLIIDNKPLIRAIFDGKKSMFFCCCNITVTYVGNPLIITYMFLIF